MISVCFALALPGRNDDATYRTCATIARGSVAAPTAPATTWSRSGSSSSSSATASAALAAMCRQAPGTTGCVVVGATATATAALE